MTSRFSFLHSLFHRLSNIFPPKAAGRAGGSRPTNGQGAEYRSITKVSPPNFEHNSAPPDPPETWDPNYNWNNDDSHLSKKRLARDTFGLPIPKVPHHEEEGAG